MRRELLSHVPRMGIALMLLALPLQACLEPLSVECGPDLVCPAGQKCAANQQVCIKTDCGDGIVQEGELCDDGNVRDGDGCDSKCKSMEVCGNGIKDQGEVCDDGDNLREGGCSFNCLSFETCGNGVIDGPEECDDKGKDSARCNSNCTLSRCGDGYKNTAANEQCDDAGESKECNFNCTLSKPDDGILNKTSGEECDSGGADTAYCDADGTLPRCGDGYPNTAAGEECDAAGESKDCNINCKWSRCGDGIVNAHHGEACDDGNKEPCGTCSKDCSEPQVSTSARGSIVIAQSASDALDGKWFSIDDGIHKSVVFEFDKDHTTTPGRVVIDVTSSRTPDELANFIKNIINDAADLNIEASISPVSWNVVRLKNTLPGDRGNNDLFQTGGTFAFTVDGMSGGSGAGACDEGRGCRYNQDCKSGSCQSGKCQ
jgi:cysteine-rich repeat protein